MPQSTADGQVLRRVAVGVFALGCLMSVVALQQTWRQPVLDQHSFRQTQTAITAYWIGEGGPLLAYETPVLGAPWSVPFELPLYQAIAGGVHRLGLPLDGAGRLVSWLFLLATLWQLYAIVRKLGGSRHFGLLLGGLVLVSPHYLFWSRTFMIESTALFFSVAFVSAAVSHVRAPSLWTTNALLVTASLAALVKITTFVPFGLAAMMVVAWDLRDRSHWRDVRRWALRYAPIAFAGLVSIVVVSMWTHFADSLKVDHPFGRNLTSDKLSPWLYGTMKQRLSPILWRDVVFGRTLQEALGSALPLWASLSAAIAFGRAAIAWCAVLVALYLVPFLVFTNLHWVHNYYQYANAGFVVVLVGVVVWHGNMRGGWRRWLALALLAFTVVMQLVRFARVEWPSMTASQQRSDTMQLRRALAGVRTDGVILVFGYDWSAEAAYYARRRAMTVPNWSSREQLESLRKRPIVHTGGLPIVAVIDCPNPLRGSPDLGPIVAEIVDEQTRGLEARKVASCTLWR